MKFSHFNSNSAQGKPLKRTGKSIVCVLFLLTAFAPMTVFASDITNIINQLPASVRSRLPSSFLSSPTTQNLGTLSPSTIKTVMSNLPSGTIPSLPTDMFSSVPSSSLPNVLSGLAGPLLKTLPTGTLSSLPAGTLTNILSGLSGGALRSLPDNLLSSLPQGTLTSALSGLSGGTLGSLPSNLVSAIPSSVMSALPSSITSLLPSSALSSLPGVGGVVGGGGIFVPVNDAALNGAFSSYVSQFSTFSSNFDRYAGEMNSALTGSTDSLRNIIAGKDPGGVAKEDCVTDTYAGRNLLEPYPSGPWQEAIASSSENGLIPLPTNIDAQVNSSGSLRCILQDLVGYQKISLFVQIQQMLKQYIADVQQQELSNNLLNQINAANLNWAKEGEQVEAGGILTTEPVYVLNSDKSMQSRNTRTVDTIVAQATAAPGDPVGSLGLNWPLETATQVAINERDQMEDPRNSFAKDTQGTLTANNGPFPGAQNGPAAFDNYMRDANTPEGLGAVDTFASMLNNPQNTPIGEAALVQAETDRRIAADEARYQRELQGSGFQPTQKCSGLPSDPNCDPALMTNVSPSAQNAAVVTGAVQSGNEQIANSTTLDSTPADAAQNLSTSASTQGAYGYDTTALQTSKTAVNTLIHELYDTIGNAYFDLNDNQTKWSQAALLMIYDEMKFDSNTPQVVQTTGTGEQPITQ